ncbi:hypothetical protein VPH234P6_0207 [Vibrio phage 234P6]
MADVVSSYKYERGIARLQITFCYIHQRFYNFREILPVSHSKRF